MANILDTLGGLGLNALIPLVSLADPSLSKLISDTKDALSDGKITLDEAKTILTDAIAEAKTRLPKFAIAFGSLEDNINNDLPKLIQAEQLVAEVYPKLSQTFELFKNS